MSNVEVRNRSALSFYKIDRIHYFEILRFVNLLFCGSKLACYKNCVLRNQYHFRISIVFPYKNDVQILYDTRSRLRSDPPGK